MNFIIKYHKAADKEISKLSVELQLEILQVVEELAINPRPFGYKKLSHYKSTREPNKTCYRIKIQKDYRMIYTIEQQTITITVVKVKHRKEVYQ
jgi:mRNA interferase RelE/StbE